jgi:hypothetical protein
MNVMTAGPEVGSRIEILPKHLGKLRQGIVLSVTYTEELGVEWQD